MKMMLAIVVLVVASCCYTSVATTEDDDSVVLPDIDESEVDFDILEKLAGEIRRQKGSGFGNTFQDSCTMNCIKNNKDKQSEKHFYRQIHNNRVKINEFFNQTSLQHSCQVLTRIMNCIAGCDNQQSVSFYNRLLEPFKYMCTDSRFLDYVPCYRQVYDETWVTCNAPETCRHKQKTMNQIMKQNVTVLASMTQFCDLLNCYQDCQHTKMVQICGEEKEKVLNKFYRIGLAMIKDQMFEETSGKATWPFQCSRVGIDID